jgi:nitrous oxidase accessory protein
VKTLRSLLGELAPTIFIFILLPQNAFGEVVVRDSEALVAAVREEPAGSTITIAAGTYEIDVPLEPKAGMTLNGAGTDKTIITHTADWKPSTEKLPDSEIDMKRIDTYAYLVRLQDKAADVTISDFTLRAPQLHGAIFGASNESLHLYRLRIEDVLYCGVRTFFSRGAKIHDCEFIDAGGRWKRGGIPGTDGGISGGAMFVTWMTDSEIAHNRITRTKSGGEHGHYGIKGRGGRRIHIHHNTIGVNFSIEFPFEGADSFEIDHNILHGVVSIPKYAGGNVPERGRTYYIHHNYFTTSYAIEFVRNGVEIDHNLFDFDVEQDGGNLISAFGRAPAPGPAVFHNNLVSNPGRGVIWINEPYDNLTVRNNHIISRTTATPRKEGLFGLNGKSDFGTIQIVDNIIECRGQPRPLLRNDASYGATIRNNRLTNVADADRYENPQTDAEPGLEEPLAFRCGAQGELTVDGWKTRPTERTSN